MGKFTGRAGEARTGYQLLLVGETPLRRSRVCAAADVAAAKSGPIGTHGLERCIGFVQEHSTHDSTVFSQHVIENRARRA